jgi:hypothetical protein
MNLAIEDLKNLEKEFENDFTNFFTDLEKFISKKLENIN